MMTVLVVDAMYFHAARQAFERAGQSIKLIERAEKRVARHQAKIDSINEQLEEGEIDDSTHYDKLEPLAIQMDGLEYQLGAAYGPFLEHLAAVHIFSTAALEAHVNIRGQELLSGRTWDLFERLSLDAKWLFLPRFHGLPGFDPGAQPFQGFDRLIKIRNKLVHYRVRREPWQSSGVPEFLEELGLSLAAAEQSLVTVRDMAKELARQLGDREPWWFEAEEVSFFEIEQERAP